MQTLAFFLIGHFILKQSLASLVMAMWSRVFPESSSLGLFLYDLSTTFGIRVSHLAGCLFYSSTDFIKDFSSHTGLEVSLL